MSSDSFFLLSHVFYVIYISAILHSKTVRLYKPPVFVVLVSSLGIDLISGSLSPLVLGVVPDARPPFRVDRCRASTLPHSPPSSRTHCRSFVPQPARYLTNRMRSGRPEHHGWESELVGPGLHCIK
jgi:hypothetical protein